MALSGAFRRAGSPSAGYAAPSAIARHFGGMSGRRAPLNFGSHGPNFRSS